MGKQKGTKINQLHDLLEEGLLAPTWWLEEQGYSHALLSKYVASGWLSSPAHGVYRRPGPPRESVHEADVLMQGMANLRPAVVMTLLKDCHSIKVKRLFLALAEKNQFSWFKHLDHDAIAKELGTGKRMLVPGGKLHPKYLITLPADLDDA